MFWQLERIILEMFKTIVINPLNNASYNKNLLCAFSLPSAGLRLQQYLVLAGLCHACGRQPEKSASGAISTYSSSSHKVTRGSCPPETEKHLRELPLHLCLLSPYDRHPGWQTSRIFWAKVNRVELNFSATKSSYDVVTVLQHTRQLC